MAWHGMVWCGVLTATGPTAPLKVNVETFRSEWSNISSFNLCGNSHFIVCVFVCYQVPGLRLCSGTVYHATDLSADATYLTLGNI